MLGQMMRLPLVIGSLIDHADRYHRDGEIVSVETDRQIVRKTWGDIAVGSRRLASALGTFGLTLGARCATLAWNNYRHLEIYFGVSGSGLVCHTLNPRLAPEQMVYIINNAEDQVLFVDKTFLPIVAALRDKLPTLRAVILMSGRDEEAAAKVPGLRFYDEFVADGDASFTWPKFSEDTASSLCYTSGTTGLPKGVLYSHRSTLLHSFAVSMPDALAISSTDRILPVVPMFHVNAWGTPYAAAMNGATLIMPGPGLDGASLVDLIDGERVTLALGVPTIWHQLLAAAKQKGSRLDSLTTTIVGGSACPPSMIKTFREEYDVDTVHAWGMTELSPVGSVNRLLGKHQSLSDEERAQLRLNQGRPPFGIDLKLVDDDGADVAHDGAKSGALVVRGHWVVDTYFKSETGNALTPDGWFHTGDIATLDGDGYMTIRDRSKDVIKSGGEWISSVELENIAVGHPALADAAVVGVAHDKWGERPIVVAVRAPDKDPSADEILACFTDRVPRWQIPDAVFFVDTLPRTATGKVLKTALREQFKDALTK